MGLIKAAASAIGGTLGDQWEDYITCNELSSDVLIVKKTTKTGQISAKSRIQVNPGQAIIVVDSGRILDVSAEEGIYSGKGKRRREFPRHRLLVLLGERERKCRSMGCHGVHITPTSFPSSAVQNPGCTLKKSFMFAQQKS